ncbi:MAG: ABC transporter permease [Deferribacteraceae bacterium]|jgi:putative ABC transport system permease protein|nr:ABC transporter permease [Deferribacteraceae bacterium]
MNKLFRQYSGLFKEAVRATLASKSRIALSALCIGLGIAGVTLVTALGAAAISKGAELMNIFGTDTVMIFSGGKKKLAAGSRERTLTVDDVEGLRANFPDAYLVSALRWHPGLMVYYQNSKLMSEVDGVLKSATLEWNWTVDIGRDFNEKDNEFSANVCVIGSYVRETLFGDGDPIGKQIKLGKNMCEVIGVTQKKSIGAFDDHMNTFVMVPESVFLKKFSWQKNFMLGLRMRFYDSKSIDTQVESVREYLRHNHNLNEGEEDDFQIFTPSMLAGIFMAVLGAIGAFLGTITLVVVIVGGFVTANIFLLSTQTRVKEIGIRRAFGATKSDIFKQFIIEFIMIAFCGMLFGLILGGSVSAVITSFGFLEVRITLPVFLITAAASLAIALTFGILPAKSAAKITPIEAIRTL